MIEVYVFHYFLLLVLPGYLQEITGQFRARYESLRRCPQSGPGALKTPGQGPQGLEGLSPLKLIKDNETAVKLEKLVNLV